MKTFNTVNVKLLNKSEIARQLGISQAYVSLILNGHKKGGKYRALILEVIRKNIKNAA